MQVATFIANFTFCSVLLCLCYGAPPEEDNIPFRDMRFKYTEEEELFIINELKRYPDKVLPIWGNTMWIEIAKNHDKMRELNVSEIPPRTPVAIARHFQRTMLHSKGNVKLPDDLIRRIPKAKSKKQGDDSGPSNPLENQHQDVTSRPGVSRAVHLGEIRMRDKYTPKEDEFIINAVKNFPRISGLVFKDKRWTKIAEQLKEMRKSDPSNFPTERSGAALRERFRRLCRKSDNKRRRTAEYPMENEEADTEEGSHRYSKEEDRFIIKELLRLTSTAIDPVSMWKEIKAQHDMNVQSKTPGFEYFRPGRGLKNRFHKHLIDQTNQVPPALLEKISQNVPGTKGGTSGAFHFTGETSHARDAGDDDSALWDWACRFIAHEGEGLSDDVIQELANAPVEVDFDSLQDWTGNPPASEGEKGSSSSALSRPCRRVRYSPDDELFLIDEMRRYPDIWLPIWGQEMWIEIAKNYSKMRESNPTQYPPRTDVAFARYFQKKMLRSKGLVQLPDDLIKRIPKAQKYIQGDGSSRDSSPTDSSEDKHQDGGLAAHLRKIRMRNEYTPEEDEFIINFAKNIPRDSGSAFGDKTWIQATEQHKELRKLYPSNFPLERSSGALRERFRRLYQHSQKKKLKITNTRTENEEVLDADRVNFRYSKEEDKFIVEELLKPTCTNIRSTLTWKKIKAQHDIKVRTKTPGFNHFRPPRGLKKRFLVYIAEQTNQVPLALKQKIAQDLQLAQVGTSGEIHSTGETSQARDAGNEDSDFGDFSWLQDSFMDLMGETAGECGQNAGESSTFDGMVQELLDAPYDVDFEALKNQ